MSAHFIATPSACSSISTGQCDALHGAARRLFQIVSALGTRSPVCSVAQAQQALACGYETAAKRHERRGDFASRDRDLACAKALRAAMTRSSNSTITRS